MSAAGDIPPEQPRTPEGSGGPPLPELTSRSRDVLRALARERARAAYFYRGALRILADLSNPVRIESAAYCLRELIEELERVAVAPKTGPGLADLLNNFRPIWEAAERRESDHGLVDNCDRAVFATDQLLEDAASNHSTRKHRAQTTIYELDPVQRPGPPDVNEERAQRLLDFRGHFNRVLHGHVGTDSHSFESSLEDFEAFLLALLRPPTFEDFGEIDNLIEEGPP